PLIDPMFLLASEVSGIYTQGGKGRRVHTLIWVPSLESARKINKEMTRQGCNLLSDGRPIIGLTSIQVAELVFTIEPKALVIPAHCLVPDAHILQEDFISKEIQEIEVGEQVLTHTGVTQRVTEVKKRAYSGDVVTIQPWYFRPGLTTTPEHPYYAIKTVKKCPSTGDICRPSLAHKKLCKQKAYMGYRPTWILAKDLTVGDVLVYPRSIPRKRISQISLIDSEKKNESYNTSISAGGSRGRTIHSILKLTPSLGRLLGYYLAEGSTDGNNSFSFCFSNKEKEYIDDVVSLVQEEFQLGHPRIYLRNKAQSVEITFYSKIHAEWFARACYTGSVRRAFSKRIPDFLLQAESIVQAECLRGWYRGDKGYTSSQTLMNQMKAMSLMLGIIPSIHIDTVEMHTKRGKHTIGDRTIHASHPSYFFSNFAFFIDSFNLKKEIPRSQTKIDRKHGWIDDTNVYLPIKDRTTTSYKGDVYNLEVEHDHSYVAEFAAVHNCWTPWFAMYGSKSGFDSIADAFGPYADRIYAVETGLSSNPAMNWCIPELDTRTILSFSDAHSLPKLGREATVFEFPEGELSYDA
ncbi:MAG: LAGLIDADG family homing endonuclease, partial [Patescibacteria group bacterium]